MSHGPSKRETAKAEKEAEVVVQSLRSAGDAAVATTLAGITNVLKANRPLMYHIHALLLNEEWKSVLMATAMGDGEDEAGGSPSSGAKPEKSHQKLRAKLCKFEQLTRRSLSPFLFLRHMVHLESPNWARLPLEAPN